MAIDDDDLEIEVVSEDLAELEMEASFIVELMKGVNPEIDEEEAFFILMDYMVDGFAFDKAREVGERIRKGAKLSDNQVKH